MRLEDRVALVTGAGSGIGREIAKTLAAEGAKIASVDLRPETAEETLGLIEGDGHFACAVDVSDPDSVREMVGKVDAALGRIDVLVNNAGVDHIPGDGREKLLETGQQTIHMSDDGFTKLMAINVNGVFFCLRESIKVMQREEQGGSIINMSSIAGLSPNGNVSYAASKAAVLGITRATARELGRFGIRVNAICPGVIETPMTAEVDGAMLKPLLRATPLGRKGQPSDIANTALFLASDESSFITGQWISPNGGLVMQ
ncbi:MAG: SDR family NAD(P)-dependent oxidoreductase [Myxococcota bacterium]